MKIKLVSPEQNRSSSISTSEVAKVLKVSLPLLAALTPPEHEVALVDESFAVDDPDEPVDLVGITVLTELVPRAYQIAEAYRKRGAKVVLGGIHPSVLPEEAMQHADAVVVGEGEEVWPRLVRDAADGKLQKLYRAERPTDLARLPVPARGLYPKPSRLTLIPRSTGIEASRGCVFDCEFCSIGSVMGRSYRARPFERVVEEIEATDSKHLFFVDDALALQRSQAGFLFQAMASLRRAWIGQGTLSLAEDPELLENMRRSGCHGLLVGFESVVPATQGRMRKGRALKISQTEAVRRFHGEGISILGAFVFGTDGEGEDVFDRTIEFALKNRLEGLQVRLLCPFPGTALYRRLLDAGRLWMPDWWLKGHDSNTLLFQPLGMSPEALVSGVQRVRRELHTVSGIASRFLGVSLAKRQPMDVLLYAGLNLGQRKRYKSACHTVSEARPMRA